MSKVLSSRTSVAVAAALFALATWFGSTHELSSAPTSLVLTQPASASTNIIAAASNSRM